MTDAVSAVTPAAIAQTYAVIAPHIRRTPTLELSGADFGTAALAALLSHAYQPSADEHVAVVLSGANTTAVNFSV